MAHAGPFPAEGYSVNPQGGPGLSSNTSVRARRKPGSRPSDGPAKTKAASRQASASRPSPQAAFADILVLGAGYGGLRATLDADRLLRFDRDLKIAIVNPHPYHQFRTELHRAATGTTRLEDVHIPLRQILRRSRVRFIQGLVTRIAPQEQAVQLADGRRLRFRRLVVAMGGQVEDFQIPGLAEYGLTLQSVNSAAVVRRHIEGVVEAAAQASGDERRALLTVAVGGGGFTGVEIAAELAERMPKIMRRRGLDPKELRLVVIEALPEILPGFDQDLVRRGKRHLERLGVELLLETRIERVEAGRVHLEGREPLECRTFVWAGGIRGNEVVERSLSTAGRGRALVNEYLQSVDDPAIYCIGDCALVQHPRTGQPVATTAQHAIEQGRLVAYNLWAERTGRPLKRYVPRERGWSASLGRSYGLAKVDGRRISGAPAALLKDLITLHYAYSIGGPKLLLRRWVAAP